MKKKKEKEGEGEREEELGSLKDWSSEVLASSCLLD